MHPNIPDNLMCELDNESSRFRYIPTLPPGPTTGIHVRFGLFEDGRPGRHCSTPFMHLLTITGMDWLRKGPIADAPPCCLLSCRRHAYMQLWCDHQTQSAPFETATWQRVCSLTFSSYAAMVGPVDPSNGFHTTPWVGCLVRGLEFRMATAPPGAEASGQQKHPKTSRNNTEQFYTCKRSAS